MNLTNTTICIPGGNNGLGLELVKILARVCKKIFVIDKDMKCEELWKLNNIEYYRIDLSHKKMEIFDEDIDILILNTNIMNLKLKKLLNLSFEDTKNAISLNIFYNFRLIKSFRPKRLVILEKSNLNEKNYIVFAISEYLKAFYKALELEGISSMFVFIPKHKDDNYSDIKIARMIVKGLQDDLRKIYVPSKDNCFDLVWGNVEEVELREYVLNLILKNNEINSRNKKSNFDIPEVERTISGSKCFFYKGAEEEDFKYLKNQLCSLNKELKKESERLRLESQLKKNEEELRINDKIINLRTKCLTKLQEAYILKFGDTHLSEILKSRMIKKCWQIVKDHKTVESLEIMSHCSIEQLTMYHKFKFVEFEDLIEYKKLCLQRIFNVLKACNSKVTNIESVQEIVEVAELTSSKNTLGSAFAEYGPYSFDKMSLKLLIVLFDIYKRE